MNPVVSICLPTLNAQPFLAPRMESIMSQTLTDWELIIVDNYSDDGSWEFFQGYSDDPRVSLAQAPRQGMYANWNNCLRRCAGEFVYIATADDTMRPECLARMVGAMGRGTFAGGRPAICRCAFDFIDEHGGVLSTPPRGGAWSFLDRHGMASGLISRFDETLVQVLVDTSWTTITAVLFRRDLLDAAGLFPTDCGAIGDRAWAVGASLSTDSLAIPERLATWRWHPNQGSRTIPVRGRRMMQRRLEAALWDSRRELPDRWTSRTNWFDELVEPSRGDYQRLFALDRLTLRTAPIRFVRGLARAAFWEPAFLLRRMKDRFRWPAFDDDALIEQTFARYRTASAVGQPEIAD